MEAACFPEKTVDFGCPPPYPYTVPAKGGPEYSTEYRNPYYVYDIRINACTLVIITKLSSRDE